MIVVQLNQYYIVEYSEPYMMNSNEFVHYDILMIIYFIHIVNITVG